MRIFSRDASILSWSNAKVESLFWGGIIPACSAGNVIDIPRNQEAIILPNDFHYRLWRNVFGSNFVCDLTPRHKFLYKSRKTYSHVAFSFFFPPETARKFVPSALESLFAQKFSPPVLTILLPDRRDGVRAKRARGKVLWTLLSN